MRRNYTTSLGVTAAAVAAELHTWLRENPGQPTRAIEDRFGLNDNQLNVVLLAAERAGILFYEEMAPNFGSGGRHGERLLYFAFEAELLEEV